MAFLSKLTLTKFKRSQTHQDPVLDRRAKVLNALAQQRDVLNAALEGREHTVKSAKWANDEHGNRHRIEKDKIVRPWFFKEAQGWLVRLKYGARIVPLDTEHNAVVVPALNDVAEVLDVFEKALRAGEFDKSLSVLAQRKTKSAEIDLKSIDTTVIASLNDTARRTLTGCRVHMTPGIQALYQTNAIITRVQAYSDFNERNDPYGEHDFGSFEFCGETVFWKFDYYDLDYSMRSLDPSDLTITARMLTVMLGDEY